MMIRIGSPGCPPSCAAMSVEATHANARVARAIRKVPIAQRIDLRGLYVKGFSRRALRRVRLHLIEHEVHDNAREGDVHPGGERPFGDPFVLDVSAAQSPG